MRKEPRNRIHQLHHGNGLFEAFLQTAPGRKLSLYPPTARPRLGPPSASQSTNQRAPKLPQSLGSVVRSGRLSKLRFCKLSLSLGLVPSHLLPHATLYNPSAAARLHRFIKKSSTSLAFLHRTTASSYCNSPLPALIIPVPRLLFVHCPLPSVAFFFPCSIVKKWTSEETSPVHIAIYTNA